VVDTFDDGTLTEYTQTTVLDNGAARNTNFQIVGGTLQATSPANDGPEQVLLLRSDVGLAVGEVLRVDVPAYLPGGNQDFALAIAATATPTVTTLLNGPSRSDYAFVGLRGSNTQIIASGFNGTTSLGTNQVFGQNVAGLFIRRNTPTQFVVGYNNVGGQDTTAFTFNLTNTSIGNAIGFFTDNRAASTIGSFDNLRITAIPEPATLGALALAGTIVGRRRRVTA
jgi:hypothetical protein